MQHEQGKLGRYPRTLTEHEPLVLSDRDREAVFDALIHPPEPSERLERALAEHKLRVVS